MSAGRPDGKLDAYRHQAGLAASRNEDKRRLRVSRTRLYLACRWACLPADVGVLAGRPACSEQQRCCAQPAR